MERDPPLRKKRPEPSGRHRKVSSLVSQKLLEQENSLQFLEVLDGEIWAQIRRGEILEIEADISVSSLTKFAEIGQSLQAIAKVAELAGEPLELGADAEQGIEMITAFNKMGSSKIPIVAVAAGAVDYRFIAALEPSKGRVDLDELEGESTFVAKVQRKLRDGETYTAFDSIPGMSAFHAANVERLLRGFGMHPSSRIL